MLEQILKLYTAAMLFDVRGLIPHLVGPPGCGKSTVAQQAADLLGVQLWTINVSRISPLELEGLQMPVDNSTRLEMLTARYWTRIKEGDIVLFDEFLRGFPEVYNGLLDIITAREVNGYKLPKAFFLAASNSVATYDRALEDRLLHLPVADPRSNNAERKRLGQLIVDALGLLPVMAESYEMDALLRDDVLPTFAVLDMLERKGTGVTSTTDKGYSIRNLISQVQLRHVKSSRMADLLSQNNARAMASHEYWYVVLLPRPQLHAREAHYAAKAEELKGNPRLTPVQAMNVAMNLQLIHLSQAQEELNEPQSAPDNDIFF